MSHSNIRDFAMKKYFTNNEIGPCVLNALGSLFGCYGINLSSVPSRNQSEQSQ